MSQNPYSSPQHSGPPYYQQPPQYRPPNTGMAVASLIVGIISIPMSCLCTLFSLPLGILAVILGFVAQSQIKQGTADGKGMATAGIICGFVSIGLAVLFLVLAIFMQMPGVMEQFR